MWTHSYEAELLIACFHEFVYLLIALPMDNITALGGQVKNFENSTRMAGVAVLFREEILNRNNGFRFLYLKKYFILCILYIHYSPTY